MKKYLLAFISILAAVPAVAKDYYVSSPDGHLKAYVSDAGKVSWSIVRDDVTILPPSRRPSMRPSLSAERWENMSR